MESFIFTKNFEEKNQEKNFIISCIIAPDNPQYRSMIVNKISLIHFKNHSEKSFEFSPQINCFVGNNGAGKTNVLDAIHYLSVGKSFLGNTDVSNILFGEDFFSIESEIHDGEKENIIRIQQPKDHKKTIKKKQQNV